MFNEAAQRGNERPARGLAPRRVPFGVERGERLGSERAMGDGCSVSSECKRALFFSPPLVHRPTDGRRKSEEEDDTHANHTAAAAAERRKGEKKRNRTSGRRMGTARVSVRAQASKK